MRAARVRRQRRLWRRQGGAAAPAARASWRCRKAARAPQLHDSRHASKLSYVFFLESEVKASKGTARRLVLHLSHSRSRPGGSQLFLAA